MKIKKVLLSKLIVLSDSELLHVIAGNYNWDNGFEIPYSILNNDEL